ncbi:MAG: hypothetical protein ACFFFK_09640 [Candidatus Thorarchaeota archaeon]
MSVALSHAELAAAQGETLVIRGDTITISAILLQNGSYGTPVANQMIFFFDQTQNIELGSDTTDANGIASISWIVPIDYPLGPTTINSTFYGNDSLSLAPSYQLIVLTVLSSTNIVIDQTTDTLAPGDILSFSVHLIDDSDRSIEDAAIAVYKDNTLLAMNKTNALGETHFQIECNSSWISLGSNDIRVVYNQDLVYFLDKSEYTFTVDISKIPTTIIPQGSTPDEITLNEFFDIHFQLSESTESLPNEVLEVTLDGQFLLDTITNNSGLVHLFVNINERFSLGPHTIRLSYNGTERYAESFFETSFDVLSPVLVIIEPPESAKINDNVEISISISDLLGRIIPSFLITISDTTSNQRFTIAASTTEITTTIQYELKGPSGVHVLNIELTENSFIMNSSLTSTLTVWSNPKISIVASNVEHYAFPNQNVSLEIQMNDWAGNCSFRHILLLIDDVYQFSVSTDIHGRATFVFLVPFIENQYNISLFYAGNATLYELTTRSDYNLQVTHLMPIRIELDSYETVTSLRKLSVCLRVKALNGSSPKGIHVRFSWLDSITDVESEEEGLIILSLKIPATSGTFILFYESESSTSVLSTDGSFQIEISQSDIMSLQGVGITGLALALIASIGISTVPLIRRKYLVG